MNLRDQFITELESLKNEKSIPGAMWFFKTGPGQYGEGDQFWGISVPKQRQVAKKYARILGAEDYSHLLRHPIHEVRLTTLMLMVYVFQKAKTEDIRQAIAEIYLDSVDYVNNWDLVDASAHHILGQWLLSRDYSVLLDLAKKDHLWSQRIAIVATHAFIRNRIFEPTLSISAILLNHPHDLIHKAVGWMLREVGNVDFDTEYRFLEAHYRTMPRTMLRYAIEKFDEELRQRFLKGTIQPV